MNPKLFRQEELVYDETTDFIGRGEFGNVYRAQRTDTNETVALKLLTTPQRLNAQQEGGFKKEASVLQYLHYHPNVVRLHGICVHPRHYALVLEYVPYNLDRLICDCLDEHPGMRRWDIRFVIAYEVAMGMTYLHSLDPPIVHRDLKSSNVLIGHEYHAKLSDFGLAKVRGISSQTTRKSERGPGNPSGTLPFIAPERFHQEFETTEKVDVYGYAIVLWQLTELKKPYENGMDHYIVQDVITLKKRLPLSQNDADARFQMNDLIQVCWDHHPDTRPPFQEIARTLEAKWPEVKCRAGVQYTKRGGVLSKPAEVEAAAAERAPPLAGDSIHREINTKEFGSLLRKHWEEILDKLDPTPVLYFMYPRAKETEMTSSDRQKIECEKNRRDGAKELLKFMELRGEEIFRLFLLALKNRQPNLYEKFLPK
ncbi:receptor-interacting serine/threonine-protein kinase 2-like [Oscarella lobularis]|uniref:receptor-interacting serine/threonine-protein kinase 2-like n=1 Tax=Oscarella lobularis TaxID=121494 RepID=UPI00331310A8